MPNGKPASQIINPPPASKPDLEDAMVRIDEQFLSELKKAGLYTKDRIIPDGRLHRFHVDGDRPGSKNGWYALYGDNVPAGAFGSWKTGQTFKWCPIAPHGLTPAQRKENAHRMAEARKARAAEEKERQTIARNKAQSIWNAAPTAPDTHPYLVKKGVDNHGLRLYKGSLVIPIRSVDNIMHSLQFIDSEGKKRFLSGGRKKSCFFLIGKPQGHLCIAEGYATATSVYEATGFACAVTFAGS